MLSATASPAHQRPTRQSAPPFVIDLQHVTKHQRVIDLHKLATARLEQTEKVSLKAETSQVLATDRSSEDGASVIARMSAIAQDHIGHRRNLSKELTGPARVFPTNFMSSKEPLLQAV